jgi:hypothetical protein
MNCPYCDIPVMAITPSCTADATTRVYCPKCKALFAVVQSNHGATCNPNMKLILMGVKAND